MKAFRFISLALVVSLLAVCSANSLSLSAGDSIQSQQQQAQQLGAAQQASQQGDTNEKDSIVSAARHLGNVQAYESQPAISYQTPVQSYSSVNITTPVYQQQQQQQRVYQQASYSSNVYTAPPVQQAYSNYSAVAKVQSVQSAPLYLPKQMQQYPAAQNQQQQQKYLDTQPEFTQAWADYPQPPGYLPQAYRHVPYVPGIGLGYITWLGPINPQSFYTPVQLPYYYRFPPQSPHYNPAPPSYSMAQPVPVIKHMRP